MRDSTSPRQYLPISNVNRLNPRFVVKKVAGFLAATAIFSLGVSAKADYQPVLTTLCSTSIARIETGFPTANAGSCVRRSETYFELRLYPEDDPPINPSPWYSFAVQRTTADPNQRIIIRLDYGSFEHRYHPKYSYDQVNWEPLSVLDSHDESFSSAVELAVPVGLQRIYISGQEFIDNRTYESWLSEWHEQASESQIITLGYSVQRRSINALIIGPEMSRFMLILGRGHPPEVTGAFALKTFVDTLLANRISTCDKNDSLCRFKNNYGLAVVPNYNPDGVALGHWRHNTQSQDLNRDWGKFDQPETFAVNAYVMQRLKRGHRLGLMLDFHSTNRSVLFTQLDADTTTPRDFANNWLEHAKLESFDLHVENGKRSTRANGTSKSYFYLLTRAPSITYEVSDHENRKNIQQVARILAKSMMQIYGEFDG